MTNNPFDMKINVNNMKPTPGNQPPAKGPDMSVQKVERARDGVTTQADHSNSGRSGATLRGIE